MGLILKQVDDWGTYWDRDTNRTGHVIKEPDGGITFEFVDDTEQMGHVHLRAKDVTLLPKGVPSEVD